MLPHCIRTSDRSSKPIIGSDILQRRNEEKWRKRGKEGGGVRVANRDRCSYPREDTSHSLLPVLVMNKLHQKCVESNHLIEVRCLALHTQEIGSKHSTP